MAAGAFLLLSLPSEPAAGQSLQRLFSTPAMRAELDRRRLRVSQGQPMVETIAAPVAIPVAPLQEEEIVYQLSGIVSRSDGYYTVWVNNRPYPHDQLPDNMELLAQRGEERLRIRNPETGEAFIVLPGQVLNLTTGEILESYQRSIQSPVSPTGVEPDPATTGNGDDPDSQSAPAQEQAISQ